MNTITGVQEATAKLAKAFSKKYPEASGSKFEVGIDPMNGKYSIVVSLKTKALQGSLGKRFPATVDGYRVIVDGVTPLIVPPDMDFT